MIKGSCLWSKPEWPAPLPWMPCRCELLLFWVWLVALISSNNCKKKRSGNIKSFSIDFIQRQMIFSQRFPWHQPTLTVSNNITNFWMPSLSARGTSIEFTKPEIVLSLTRPGLAWIKTKWNISSQVEEGEECRLCGFPLCADHRVSLLNKAPKKHHFFLGIRLK